MTVEETFKITGRGLILVGKFNSELEKVGVGSYIVVVKSSGEELDLVIKGIEFITRIDRSQPYKYFSFSVGEVEKEVVPIGSEVFIKE